MYQKNSKIQREYGKSRYKENPGSYEKYQKRRTEKK